jgi:hypothetical protein
LVLLLTGDSLRAPGLLQVLRIEIHAVLFGEGTDGVSQAASHEPRQRILTLPRLSELFSRGAIFLTHTTQTPGIGKLSQAN